MAEEIKYDEVDWDEVFSRYDRSDSKKQSLLDDIVLSIDVEPDQPQEEKDRAALAKKKHRTKTKQRQQTYRKKHPERIKMRMAITTMKQRVGDEQIQFASNELQSLIKLQNGKCWWCGGKLEDDYHIDHRIPLAKGGTNKLNNLCASCPTCNLKKSDRFPWEFNGRLL